MSTKQVHEQCTAGDSLEPRDAHPTGSLTHGSYINQISPLYHCLYRRFDARKPLKRVHTCSNPDKQCHHVMALTRGGGWCTATHRFRIARVDRVIRPFNANAMTRSPWIGLQCIPNSQGGLTFAHGYAPSNVRAMR